MSDRDAIAGLLALADALARREPPPESAADWFADGVRRYLGGDAGLDECLGLRGAPGQWSPSTRLRYELRNEAVRLAASIVDGDTRKLADAIRAFESRQWPRWRNLDGPPANATAIQAALYEAFASGAPVPGSVKQLRRLVGDKSVASGVRDEAA